MPDHFLQVDLLVPVEQAPEFVKSSNKFHKAGGFGRLLGQKRGDPQRFELVLALGGRSPFSYTTSGGPARNGRQPSRVQQDFYSDSSFEKAARVVRFVHLWNIRDEADLDLTDLMRACGEDKDYMRIDSLVVTETQNFATRVRTPGAAPRMTEAPRFIRTTRTFGHADLGLFILNEPMLFPSLEKAGWHHLGQYEGYSGLLNVITDFWQTKSTRPLGEMFTSVLPADLSPRAPARVLKMFRTDVRESFKLLPYSPRAR